MDSFIFINKGPGKKKLHHTKSQLFYVLDCDISVVDCTIDNKTLVSQHKGSL